ncbi:MAG: aminotransferase class V-fold PLP-dependent enzyme [Synechococcus sp.]
MNSTSPYASLATHRSQFPALAGKTYLNFGGQGPLAQPAREAIFNAYDICSKLGPFSKAAFNWLMSEQDSLRLAMAKYLGTTPDCIALTESTIAGMNIPLWGLDWQAGDRLLLSDAEHYGVWEIARELRHRFGIELDTCPLSQGDNCVQTLADYLRPNTRMVCISHVLWNSGTILPLKDLAALCQDRGLLLHVDAAQSAGVLPLNLRELGVDFYAFTGHKWLCGPAGVGALYLSKRGQAAIRPTFTGWCKTYGKGADAFEVSTAAYPLRMGFKAALEMHDQFGKLEDRYQRQIRLAQLLWQQLQTIAGVEVCNLHLPQTGLVPFTVVDRDPVELELCLEQQGIYVRSMQDPESLRASIHYFTTEEEIGHLLEAIATVAAGSKSLSH